MSVCKFCGAETTLLVSGQPLCVQCADDIDKGRQPPHDRERKSAEEEPPQSKNKTSAAEPDMPSNIAAAERVLQALKTGEVPHRSDALKLRMLMPDDKRTGPLGEIANAVIESKTKNQKTETASTNI